MNRKRGRGMADRILDAAERLVQVRGFNAFSYADISRTLGIRKASLHHHFPRKTDLGVALVARYRRTFVEALRSIEAKADDPYDRLRRYADLYRSVLRSNRMCMCGMLAADVATLPGAMRAGVAGFFAENEAWLARVLEAGRKSGGIRFAGTAAATAAFLVGSLEGAMLVARGSGAPGHFDDAVEHLLLNLGPARSKPGRRRG